MNEIVVAKLGAEGEGIDILGRQTHGRWAFCLTRSSVFDAGGGGGGRARQSESVGDLAEVLPAIWPLLSPVDIHPVVLDWFREHYEAAVAALSPSDRAAQGEYRDRHWRRALAGYRMPWFSQLLDGST